MNDETKLKTDTIYRKEGGEGEGEIWTGNGTY